MVYNIPQLMKKQAQVIVQRETNICSINIHLLTLSKMSFTNLEERREKKEVHRLWLHFHGISTNAMNKDGGFR